MTDSLLSGFRALDLTDEKGFVCGKILAAMGVDVIKVEKPGGDQSRNNPPFIGNKPDPEKSLYWFSYNTDKRGITLNLETSLGRDLFLKLVKKSDFVLESFTPGYLNKLGLDYPVLSQTNPRIILTSITPFGQKGPYSQFKASELIISALGGVMNTNGELDRAPIREGPDAVTFRGNAAAVLGTILAHYHRQITGEGQQVDVSLQEVDANRIAGNMEILSWQFEKHLMKRNGSLRKAGLNDRKMIWRCKDGYVFWQITGGAIGGPANKSLIQWMDEEGIDHPLPQMNNWNRFDLSSISQETVAGFEEALKTLLLRHTKREIAEQSLKRGFNACVVNNPADVMEYPQLRERNYWVDLEFSDGRSPVALPGHFFLSSETKNMVKRCAPRIGQHNTEIFGQELGLTDQDIINLKRVGVI